MQIIIPTLILFVSILWGYGTHHCNENQSQDTITCKSTRPQPVKHTTNE